MLAEIKRYSPEAKQAIKKFLEKELTKHSLQGFADNFLICLDELIKNGYKANYKFCLILNNIGKSLGIADNKAALHKIVRERKRFETLADEYGYLDEVSTRVRKALSQEARLMSFKSKAKQEGRGLSSAEIETLKDSNELVLIRTLLIKYGLNVHLRFNILGSALDIEIINNAPILLEDLNRIHAKRCMFKDFADRGDETGFFISQMDDRDSGAGLGYATIDSILRDFGVDPFQVLTILSVTNTAIQMSLDLKDLKHAERTITQKPSI